MCVGLSDLQLSSLQLPLCSLQLEAGPLVLEEVQDARDAVVSPARLRAAPLGHSALSCSAALQHRVIVVVEEHTGPCMLVHGLAAGLFGPKKKNPTQNPLPAFLSLSPSLSFFISLFIRLKRRVFQRLRFCFCSSPTHVSLTASCHSVTLKAREATPTATHRKFPLIMGVVVRHNPGICSALVLFSVFQIMFQLKTKAFCINNERVYNIAKHQVKKTFVFITFKEPF